MKLLLNLKPPRAGPSPFLLFRNRNLVILGRFAQVFVLAILFLVARGAVAHSQTIIIGGPGGGAFNDRCPVGSYLVGVSTTSGKDLNVIRASCQGASNGHLTGPVVSLHVYGQWNPGWSFGTGANVTCPPDMAVEGLQIQVSKVALVHSVALRCRSLIAHDYHLTDYSGTSGGEAAYEKPVDCGGGAIANGLIGRYGALIDALGLDCEVIATAPTPLPPGQLPIRTTGKAASTPPPVPASTAKIDTTVYDRPAGRAIAYLKAGDPVTISSCNQNQWCFITQPDTGAVWGPDLQH